MQRFAPLLSKPSLHAAFLKFLPFLLEQAEVVGSLRQHLSLLLTPLDPIFQLAMDCQMFVMPEACAQWNDFPLMDLRFIT